MVAPDDTLYASGTASILGHASVHPNDTAAQLDETVANLEALLQRALASQRLKAGRLGPDSLVKVYVRHARDAALVEHGLRQHLGDEVPLLILAADICRTELLLEIEFVHRD
jgi:chorismate lyase/3-hydroxybenzoate synthase